MFEYERVGRTGQKMRTRNALKAAASELIGTGEQPTVAEVAELAGISRSTAYRYFPSQELMYAEVVLTAAVGADRQQIYAAAEDDGDAALRLDRVICADHDFTTKHEPALRAGLRAFLLLLERHPEAPREPSNRFRYLTAALQPLADQIPVAEMRRLVAALAMVVGIEAALITEVSGGLSSDESKEVKRWAATALLQAAISDSKTAQSQ